MREAVISAAYRTASAVQESVAILGVPVKSLHFLKYYGSNGVNHSLSHIWQSDPLSKHWSCHESLENKTSMFYLQCLILRIQQWSP